MPHLYEGPHEVLFPVRTQTLISEIKVEGAAVVLTP